MIKKSIISIPQKVYTDIYAHLFPKTIKAEEVAFIFASVNKAKEFIKFEFIEWYRVRPNDYRHHSLGYVELKDGMRPKIIKKAFDRDAALIEIHSHPYAQPAQFSYSDFYGFDEFVPHVWWRLKGKPYAAIVFSKSDFDGIVWIESPRHPQQLTEMSIGGKRLYPNGSSFYKKDEKYELRTF